MERIYKATKAMEHGLFLFDPEAEMLEVIVGASIIIANVINHYTDTRLRTEMVKDVTSWINEDVNA